MRHGSTQAARGTSWTQPRDRGKQYIHWILDVERSRQNGVGGGE